MYYLNKIVGAFLNPLGVGLLLLLAAGGVGVLRRMGRLRWAQGWWLVAVAFGWLWVCSLGITGRWIGLSLEREFPPMLAEQMPAADAIVVLGGGVGLNTNGWHYAELFPGADRAWHGARLFRAGKAPRVFVTSEADALFMVDLGVPREVISGPSEARNTEEEARLLQQELEKRSGRHTGSAEGSARVLLVTSAWHMRRAKMMFERYAPGVVVIPAAADHEMTTLYDKPVEFKEFVPDSALLGQNASLFKEWLGYYGYKWFRR